MRLIVGAVWPPILLALLINGAATANACSPSDRCNDDISGTDIYSNVPPDCHNCILTWSDDTLNAGTNYAPSSCQNSDNDCMNGCFADYNQCTASFDTCQAQWKDCNEACDVVNCNCALSMCVEQMSQTSTSQTSTSTSQTTTSQTSTSSTCMTKTEVLHPTHVPVSDCASQAQVQCQNLGGKLVQNQNARVPNGCGPLSNPLSTTLINAIGPQFRICCNAHDLCFAGCNFEDYVQCNNDLYACATQACSIESLFSNLEKSRTCIGPVCAVEAQELQPLCFAELGLAKLLISGQPGCDAYQDAQFDSCSCISTCAAP